MATQAALDAGFIVARARINALAGNLASMIPDADVKLIVAKVLAADNPASGFTAAHQAIDDLAGWYAGMIPDDDVKLLVSDILAAAAADAKKPANQEHD